MTLMTINDFNDFFITINNIFCRQSISLFIFAPYFGISVSKSGDRDEKGIRCNTGAVPAAVSPNTVSESNTTVTRNRDGKVQNTGRARRPAEIRCIIFCFREK